MVRGFDSDITTESIRRSAYSHRMETFTALYTKPTDNPEAFLEEYKADHLPITEKFPKMTGSTTTVFSGSPRGSEPPYYLMFEGTWDSEEDLAEAMKDPSLMEASKHAMGLIKKYGNSADMLIGSKL